jgi:hypothetical protein
MGSRAEATWPSNPWKGKVPSARRAAGWRGMDRAEASRATRVRDTEPGHDGDRGDTGRVSEREDSND